MTTAAFWLLLFLTITKVLTDIRTPAPFEWVAELVALVVGMTVATVGAYALWRITHA